MLRQGLLYIATYNMYLLLFQYNYTPTENAKCLRFSQILVFSNEHIIFGRMMIWKTLQRLATATGRSSWEINFLEMLRNLDT